jgi:cobalt-zinc-cadmium efflux system membrane fusion protein
VKANTQSTGWLWAVLLSACGGQAPAPDPVKAPEQAERTRFEPVHPADMVTVGVVPASVQVPPEHRATLAPPLEGRVLAWRVGVGDTIAPGTALMDLEVAGVADLEAELAEARQLVAARSRTLLAERQAASQGLSNASAVLAYEVAVAEAKARQQALNEQLDARKNAVGRGPEEGSGWVWTSSVTGVIERIECPAGQRAQPDMACLTVVDTSRAIVRVEVPERWLERWAIGATGHPIEGELTLTGSNTPLSVREVRRAPRLDDTSRTLSVDLAPREATALLPGQSGRVALRATVAQAGAIAVPEAAMTRLDGKDVVFGRSAKGVVPIPVERLGRDGDRVVLRPLAAAPTEVATRGLFLLKSRHLLEGAAQ